jgi:hypothetical protein
VALLLSQAQEVFDFCGKIQTRLAFYQTERLLGIGQ